MQNTDSPTGGRYGPNMERRVLCGDVRLKHGSGRRRNSPTLKEEILHEAIMTAIGKVVEDQGEFVQAFCENVIRIIGAMVVKQNRQNTIGRFRYWRIG